jgi:hypothetical protein
MIKLKMASRNALAILVRWAEWTAILTSLAACIFGIICILNYNYGYHLNKRRKPVSC